METSREAIQYAKTLYLLITDKTLFNYIGRPAFKFNLNATLLF